MFDKGRGNLPETRNSHKKYSRPIGLRQLRVIKAGLLLGGILMTSK